MNHANFFDRGSSALECRHETLDLVDRRKSRSSGCAFQPAKATF
jgi:hypothetical protein